MESSSELVAAVVQRVGELTSDLARAVGKTLGAVGKTLGALLGTDGAPKSVEEIIEQVSELMGTLARALGAVFGGLLGVGGDGPQAPADYYLSAQSLAALYNVYEKATAELIERSAAQAGELARTVSGGLSGSGGVAPNQEAGKPASPPAAPLPLVPVAPPVVPVGYSSSFLGTSWSASDVFLPLFAVIVAFSVALLQGGRLSWLRRASHGPPTAVALAIDRPG